MEGINTQNYIPMQGNEISPLNNIRNSNISGKEQLKKVSIEFEGIFVAKMLSVMDKTVDKENSLFQESKYLDNFKSIMYQDLGRQVASNPNSSIGFAKQMYTQMERSIQD